RDALVAFAPDAVVLDVMLPDGSGFELCRTIRRGGRIWDSALGILLLTARGEEADMLRGFARGADDYLRKPFSMAELVARVRALIHRRTRVRKDVFFVGALRIDIGAHEASFRGVDLELAGKEFDLLTELAFEPGAVHTKDELLTRVWHVESG